jgi:hypothetical protein
VINGHAQELPVDAVLVKQIGSLGFFFSKEQSTFFITTEDCLAGPVKFSNPVIFDKLLKRKSFDSSYVTT